MSATDDFKNELCEAFTGRVDAMSLHTANPGTTGANDSEVDHVALTWSEPSDGESSATAVFSDLVGEYPFIGLWDGDTFRQGIAVSINYSAPTDVAVMVTHSAAEES